MTSERRLVGAFDRVASRPALSALLCALVPLAAGTVAFSVRGAPLPVIHDEFSYLYAADTFAAGRLANPAHPHWPHFESFDILARPVLASRKPPGQGLFLALGQALTGRPAAGVLLSLAAACAAVYWMLRAFLEPRWALLGALLAGTHPLLFTWSVSYWGGGVALLGGALAAGAWRRLLDGPRARDAVLFALGLVVLANSRPFEGLVLALPLASSLAWRVRPRSWAPTAALVLAVGAGAMGWYNRRLTGSALRFPYSAYQNEYSTVPTFVWQKVGPPRGYRNAEFDEYWNRWVREGHRYAESVRDLWGVLKVKWTRLARSWLVPAPFALLAAAAALGLAPPSLTGLLAYFLLATTVPVLAVPLAYGSAPAGGLFFAWQTLALRGLARRSWRGRPAGRWLAAALAAWVLGAAPPYWLEYALAREAPWSARRSEAERAVVSHPGKHLVLVRYGAGHSVHEEWVYNRADMDAAPLVWARSLSAGQDAALAAYYEDRAVWACEVGTSGTVLRRLRAPLSAP